MLMVVSHRQAPAAASVTRTPFVTVRLQIRQWPTQHGGQESTILTFLLTLLHHGMVVAGLPSPKPVRIIALGRPYIGNPDLAERLKHGWPLTEADRSAYHTRRGEFGFRDFSDFSGPRATGP
jgi:hypothetical protein